VEISFSGQRDAMKMLLSLLLALGTISQERSTVADVQIHDDNADNIQPIKISHHVDEITEGDRLLERYNYVVYEFENDDGFLWARAYLDEINKVSFYGPFTDRSQKTKANAPDFEAAVVEYLKRRFHRIDRFNPDENAGDAYETMWSRPTSN
jgi:hypothetical protein